jgi:hypothetical protein
MQPLTTKEFLEITSKPHTFTMKQGGVEVVVHCSKPRMECGVCKFRIEALVSEECQRVLPKCPTRN